MKKLALALALLMCLTVMPMTAQAGLSAVETYYAIKAPSMPEIDGVIDDVWAQANIAKVEKFGSNIYGNTSTPEAHAKNPVATAEVRVMWDLDCIYVLGVVTDPTPNKTKQANQGDENIDGVDIQISEYNDDYGPMRDDNEGAANLIPGNGNVNINGKATGWGGVWYADKGYEKVESAAKDTETGYIFEAMIPLQQVTGQHGMAIGIEFQINDNQNGTGRTAIRQWSCEQCLAHSEAEHLGTCYFVMSKDETVAVTEAPEMTFGTEIPDDTDPETTAAPATTAPAGEGTDAPATEAPKTEESGCGGAIVAPVLLVAALAAVPFAFKKKEN